MKKVINFSGLGFELGQTKSGLAASPLRARDYFSILKNVGIEILDRGDLYEEESYVPIKVYAEADLTKIPGHNYQQAFMKTMALLNEKAPLVTWGGDHSVAISSVAAFTHCYNDGHVIWIDAHADLNLPCESLTGNFHGMPLAILLNLEDVATRHFQWMTCALDPQKLIYIGLRDLDPFEQDVISKLGITNFSFEDIQDLGIEFVINEISEMVMNRPVHVSFDIDSVDPEFAPATGVPVKKGLSPDELKQLGEMFFYHLNVRSVDVVEVNPYLGTSLEVDQTYITAFNFLKTIFTHTNQGDHHERMGQRDQTKRFNEMEWSL